MPKTRFERLTDLYNWFLKRFSLLSLAYMIRTGSFECAKLDASSGQMISEVRKKTSEWARMTSVWVALHFTLYGSNCASHVQVSAEYSMQYTLSLCKKKTLSIFYRRGHFCSMSSLQKEKISKISPSSLFSSLRYSGKSQTFLAARKSFSSIGISAPASGVFEKSSTELSLSVSLYLGIWLVSI